MTGSDKSAVEHTAVECISNSGICFDTTTITIMHSLVTCKLTLGRLNLIYIVYKVSVCTAHKTLCFHYTTLCTVRIIRNVWMDSIQSFELTTWWRCVRLLPGSRGLGKHVHCGLQVPEHEKPQQCRNICTVDGNTQHEDHIHINSQVIKQGKNSKTFVMPCALGSGLTMSNCGSTNGLNK